MRQNQRNGGFRRSRMRFPAGGSRNCKLDCGFNHAESTSESLAVIIPFLIHFYAWRILQIKNQLTPSASKISFFIESIESVSKPNDSLSPTYVFFLCHTCWFGAMFFNLCLGCHAPRSWLQLVGKPGRKPILWGWLFAAIRMVILWLMMG